MKCAYCGKNNKNGALFCKRCGIGLPPPAPESKAAPEAAPAENQMQVAPAEPSANAEPFDWTVSPEKAKAKAKRRRKNMLLALMLAALLIIGAAAIWFFAVSRGEILPGKNAYTVLDGGAIYKGELVKPEGEVITACASSLNGSTVGMLAQSGKLYCCSKGQVDLTANYVKRFVCSVDGKHFIYVDENGLLWSSDCTDIENAPVCICNEPVTDDFVVSPDGETVLFNKQGSPDLFLYNNKKVTLAAYAQQPVSVSNGGRYIYGFSTNDNGLYFTDKRGKSVFLRSNIVGDISLNSQHNEIVFSTDSGDGKVITMICTNGGEPRQIMNSSGPVSPVLTVSGITMKDCPAGRTVVTCPFKSFENRLFAGSGLAVCTRTGAEVLEPNDCACAAATNNYGSVYYITNGSIVKRSINGTNEAVKLCEAETFKMNANGTKLWFTLPSGELCFRHGERTERIAAPVTDYTVRPNNGAVLFLRGGEACRNTDGKTANSYCFSGLSISAIASDRYGLYGLTPDGWVKLNTGGSKVGSND